MKIACHKQAQAAAIRETYQPTIIKILSPKTDGAQLSQLHNLLKLKMYREKELFMTSILPYSSFIVF